MTSLDFDHLADRVTAMAHDPAAVVDFVEDYGDELRRAARGIVASRGRRDVLRDDGELDGLVWDVALVLQQRARSWDPAHGVPPWRWAAHAVESCVDARLGHRAAELEPEHLEQVLDSVATHPASRGEVDLDAVGRREPLVALWVEATRRVASDLHATAHLEYRVQALLGDPSPSHTVADQLGLGAANVRQIDRRVRLRLGRLAVTDPRFEPLGRLPWVDPQPPMSDLVVVQRCCSLASAA